MNDIMTYKYRLNNKGNEAKTIYESFSASSYT